MSIFIIITVEKLSVAFSPALFGSPLLHVTDIIDCAVDRHVVIVTGDVEGTVELHGPLDTRKT